MATDLHLICEELREVGLHPATRAAREKIAGALSSKWDGVQVAAAKALSQWGDPLSINTLRDLLVAVAAKPNRSSTVHAVTMALYPHMQPSDLDWVLDLFIHRTRPGNRLHVAGLFEAFAPNLVRGRLAAMLDDAHGAKRDLRAAISRAEFRSKVERTAMPGSKAPKTIPNAKHKTQKSKRVCGAAEAQEPIRGQSVYLDTTVSAVLIVGPS